MGWGGWVRNEAFYEDACMTGHGIQPWVELFSGWRVCVLLRGFQSIWPLRHRTWGPAWQEQGFSPFILLFSAQLRTHLTRLPGWPLSYLKPWLICLELRSFWLRHLPGCLEQSMFSWQLLLEGAGIHLKLPGLDDSRPPCPRDFRDQVGNDYWSVCRAWVLVFQWDLGDIWRHRNIICWWGMLYLFLPYEARDNAGIMGPPRRQDAEFSWENIIASFRKL